MSLKAKVLSILIDHLFQIASRKHPALPPFYLSIFKKDQRRHALDLVFLGYHFIPIYIYLKNPGLVSYQATQFFKNWRHHFTRAAPSGIKIN